LNSQQTKDEQNVQMLMDWGTKMCDENTLKIKEPIEESLT